MAPLPVTRATSGPADRRQPELVRLAWLPVVVLAALLAAALLARPEVVVDPPWLLASLNLVFLSVVPLLTALIAIAAYRRTGVGAILAIGAGVLATAVGGGLVPALLLYASGPNALVTVHNSSALLAAACHALAAFGGVLGFTLGRRRLLHVAITYGVVGVAVAGWLALFIAGRLPVFWAPDGPTLVRPLVVASAIGLLAISAFAWWEVSVRDRQIRFLRWYVPGLVLLGLGLAAVMTQGSVGDAVGWVGRCGQYLAAVYMLVAVLPESRHDREPQGALGVALLQAALPFRPLVESSSDAIVGLGRTCRVVYWNDAARQLLGWGTAEAFDADPVELLAPGPGTPAATLLGAPSAVVGAGPLQVDVRRRDGSLVPVEVTVYASPAEGPLVVCVIRDVTDRIRARAELEARVRERTAELELANAELERANRAKDEFLGLVSHELRTPITTILAAGSLLARRGPEADPHGLAADVVAESSRLAGIVDNLLALARLDTGRVGDPEPIMLDHLLRDRVEASRRANPDREIELRAPRGVIVEGSESQLVMVIENYLGNALKYSPPGSPVEVELTAAEGTARVAVRDRGGGIAPEEAAHLFEPFQRGSAAAATPGIGIGLTVCRRIVESLGGSVGAGNRADGPGAELAFTLPTLDEGPDGDAAATGEAAANREPGEPGAGGD